jgi:DNA-binding transcriptional ArsR family regulator
MVVFSSVSTNPDDPRASGGPVAAHEADAEAQASAGLARVSEHPRRRELLRLLEASGPLSTRALLERSHQVWGALHYHLRILEGQGLVVSALVGGRRMYDITGRPAPDPVLSLLKTSRGARSFGEILVRSGPRYQRQLQVVVGCSQRMASYYLGRLRDLGLVLCEVEGNRVYYRATQELHDAMASIEADDAEALKPTPVAASMHERPWTVEGRIGGA